MCRKIYRQPLDRDAIPAVILAKHYGGKWFDEMHVGSHQLDYGSLPTLTHRVSNVAGKLKGKSAIILHERHPEWRRLHLHVGLSLRVRS